MQAVKLFNSVYVIPGATNTGAITVKKGDRYEVYLVDTGMNADDGKRILQAVEEIFTEKNDGSDNTKTNDSFTLKAIINTHSHADHTGGNKYIQEKTGCEIYATFGETGSIINPFLQPAVVWGGFPITEIRTSYLTSESTIPTKIISSETKITLPNGGALSFVPLPGHYFDMVGVLYTLTDGVDTKSAFFMGDGVFGRAHIMKYWIPFLYDVGKFKESLEIIKNTRATWYIPSHGETTERIEETVELNQIAILSNERCILRVLEKSDLSEEDILKKCADLNEITLKPAQYALIKSTIRSYLSYLNIDGKLSYYIKENRMLWHKKQ